MKRSSSVLSPQFLTGLNLRNLLVVQVTVCALSFAAILTLIVGEFDLSLGYMLGFLMMAGAYLGGARSHPEPPPPPSG